MLLFLSAFRVLSYQLVLHFALTSILTCIRVDTQPYSYSYIPAHVLQPRCMVGVFFSSFEQKRECLFVLSDLDPLNCRRSHVGETPDRGVAANSAIQTDRPNATASVKNTSKRGPACKLDYVPERGHFGSGWVATYLLTATRLGRLSDQLSTINGKSRVRLLPHFPVSPVSFPAPLPQKWLPMLPTGSKEGGQTCAIRDICFVKPSHGAHTCTCIAMRCRQINALPKMIYPGYS